jgi:hypothetical protein
MPAPRYDFDFQDEPEVGDKGFPWTVVRTPATSVLEFIVVSHRHLGVRTHYFRNRTIGHRKGICDACKQGNVSRWTGYLLGVTNGTGQRILFEFTPSAAQYVLPLYEARESIRGLKIRASRPSKRPNGTVALAFRGYADDTSALPDAIPIKPLLFNIWGIGDPDGAELSDPAPAPMTEAEIQSTRRGNRQPRIKTAGAEEIVRDLAGQLKLPDGNGRPIG